MFKIVKIGFASSTLALVLALPASSDPYADAVAASTADGNGSDSNVLEDRDGTYRTLGDGNYITVDFTDNLCLEDGTAAADVTIYEIGGGEGGVDEDYDIAVGLAGGLLTGVTGSPDGTGDTSIDVASAVSAAPFNRVMSTDSSGLGGGGTAGADIDALECLFTLDQADIVKEHTGDETIDVGLGVQQFGFSFTIAITNNTGIDGGLAGLNFFDSVPGEFDLDPDAEDWEESPIPGNGVCVDSNNICDGIFDGNATGCTATLDTSEGAKKKARAKLEPEHIWIDASGLNNGETCTFEVFVKTDGKSFPNGKSPAFAPTSCAEDPGEIVLNDGVRVFDASMNLLLADDDMLTLECNNYTD